MRSDETDIDDPAFDRFLEIMISEAQGQSAPPDVSQSVLDSISGGSPSAAPVSVNPIIQPAPAQDQSPPRYWALAIAASLLILGGIFGWQMLDTDRVEPEIATNPDAQPEVTSDGQTAAPTPRVDLAENAPVREPTPKDTAREPSGFDIDMKDLPFVVASSDDAQAQRNSSDSPTSQYKGLDEQQIVAQLNMSLAKAWTDLDIEPASNVDKSVYTSRVAGVLGEDSAYPTDDPVANRVRSSEASLHLARRFGEYLFGQEAWRRLDDKQSRGITDALASCFQGEQAFNELVYSMIADSDSSATATWQASLRGKNSVALTNQFCDVFLDMDAACSRCHDHPLERNMAQQQYWSLVAVLRPDNDPDRKKHSVFYESPDGRQMVAQASIPPAWLANGSSNKTPDQSDLAEQLRNSDRLSQATANGLWQLVFGNRLVGRTSDPLAPPASEHFRAARDLIAQQLTAHDNDIGAAVSWILKSRAMWVGRSQSLLDKESLGSSRDALAQFELQRRAFASHTDHSQQWSFVKLIAAAEGFNRDGLQFTETLLAQPSGVPSSLAAPTPSRREQIEETLRRSFPSNSAEMTLPAGWLARFEKNNDFTQQARHLLYAAGFSDTLVDRRIDEAEKLRKSAPSDEIALNQLWWAIRLSKNVL